FQKLSYGSPEGRLEMMKMWKMTEMLELSEEQASRFFPRYSSLEKELRNISGQQRKLLIEMKKMTGEKNVITEKELENITTKISNLEQDKTEKKQEFFEGLEQVLSTDQRAKYYGFEIWFKEELRQGLKKRGGIGNYGKFDGRDKEMRDKKKMKNQR
ncbi:MAG: hypothetical protein ACJZ02_05000, partial [Candidatus Neomarinimicrobiota bacterium]